MSLRLIKTNKSLGEDLKNEPLLYSFLVVLIRHMALQINLKKVKKKKNSKTHNEINDVINACC